MANRFYSVVFILLLLLCVISCEAQHTIDPVMSAEATVTAAEIQTDVSPFLPEIYLPEESTIPKGPLPDDAEDGETASSDVMNEIFSSIPSPSPIPAPSHTPASTPLPRQTPQPTPMTTPSPTANAVSSDALTVEVETKTGSIIVTGTSLPDEASALIEKTNREREVEGLPALEYDSTLISTALIRTAEITINWSHTRPNGKKWTSLSDSINGENLAHGYDTSDSVLKAWMKSEGHRNLILNPDFTRIGAAAFQLNGIVYWVQHFGC